MERRRPTSEMQAKRLDANEVREIIGLVYGERVDVNADPPCELAA